MRRLIHHVLMLPSAAQTHCVAPRDCTPLVVPEMPPVPPWVVGNTPEPVSLDIDGCVDVTAYVRFEENVGDIDYGVLDVQTTFHHAGSLMNVYIVHCFALAESHPKCSAVVQGWVDGFAFPPPLTKMRAQHQDRWINVFLQQCIAINDRGVSVYEPNKGYRWRMVHHILYHEEQLLDFFANNVPAFTRSPVGHPPVTWSWMRPQGAVPRQMSRKGVMADFPQEVLPGDHHDADYRSTAREHRRVDTALYGRARAMLTMLQDVNRLLPLMPRPAQMQMVPPLTTLHAELSGLLYTAYLLASVHPHSDDFDIE